MVLCTPLNEAFWTPPMLLNRLMLLLTLGVIAGQMIARQPSVFLLGAGCPILSAIFAERVGGQLR
jgi:hypothetical protein